MRVTVFLFKKTGSLKHKGEKVTDISRKEIIAAIFKIPYIIRDILLADGDENIVIDKTDTPEDLGKDFIRWLNDNPLCFTSEDEFKYISLYDELYETNEQIIIHRNRPELFERISIIYREIINENPKFKELYFKFKYGAQFFTYMLEQNFPNNITWELSDFEKELGVPAGTYRSMSMIENRVFSSIQKGFQGNGIKIKSQRGPTLTNSRYMWMKIDYGKLKPTPKED